MLPCRSIGGDFFDYIDLPDSVLGFALGDVAGKGPPAALLGAMLQGSLAAQANASAGPAATVAGRQHGAGSAWHPGAVRDVVLRGALS